MDIYQLDYILHEPEESEGWMYLAEVSALQGCMAWGDTPEQTLDELRVAAARLGKEVGRGARVPARLPGAHDPSQQPIVGHCPSSGAGWASAPTTMSSTRPFRTAQITSSCFFLMLSLSCMR